MKRTVSGIIFVAIIVAGILGGAYSFAALFLCLDLLCTWELVRLFRNSRGIHINLISTGIASLILFLSAFVWFSGLLCDPRIFLIWPVWLLLSFIVEIYRPGTQDKAKPESQNLLSDRLDGLTYSLFTQIYISLPMLMLTKMSFVQAHLIEAYDYIPVLSLFILLWVSDTMAYLCGRTFGKHKLIERISPKKTWEGFFGGLIFSIIAAFALSFVFPGEMEKGLWLVYGLLVSLFGVFGDLFESLIKRTLNVKDSGNLIPGHGGLLDRMDSCLLAVPAATLFLMLLG